MMPFSKTNMRQPANLMGDSPRGGEMSRSDRGDGHRLGVQNRQIMPFSLQKHSLRNGAVWLVPKMYSTQIITDMFVQYISPLTLDILELVW
nr:MAG TPA: hypothetical protein [Caudoviricetes sp.]